MKDSEIQLKERFPYFLDKNEDSNFSKLMKVGNEHLKMLRQKTDEASYVNKLYRPILIKREQTNPNEVIRTIFVDIENIKEIIVYQNTGDPNDPRDDIVLQKWMFSYEDHKKELESDPFKHYLDLGDEPHYKATVETYDELFYTAEDGKYDESIDTLGKLLDCPRFEFKEVNESDLPLTYPPYNVDKKEPDWYYLARLNEYISLMEGMPSVCLYIWKKYLIIPELENRCKYLAQIDVDYAYPDENPASAFLHVDKLFPFPEQKITATTFFLDDNLNKINLKNAIYKSLDPEEEYTCCGYDNYSFFTDEPVYLFSVFFKEDENLPEENSKFDMKYKDRMSEITVITPRESIADIYVASNGDDNNDGRSPQTPLKTLEKAVTLLKGDELIHISSGNFELKKDVKITVNCFIEGTSTTNTKIITGEYDIVILPTKNNTELHLKKLTITNGNVSSTYNKEFVYVNRGETEMNIIWD